jgi:hypothetical protein
MLEVIPIGFPELSAFSQQDRRIRHCHQNRRVCGDDELAALPHTINQQHDQRQDAVRRQRRLRLVQEIEPVRNQSRLQQR